MNKLLFILPGVTDNPDSVFKDFAHILEFFDHENFEAYWDEGLYKQLRGKIDGDDRLSRGLRRTQMQGFTDYKHLRAMDREHHAFCNDIEVTDSILGRFVRQRLDNGHCCLVNPRGVAVPPILSHFIGSEYNGTIDTAPILDTIISINDWFADNRRPRREFKAEPARHRSKSRLVAGRTVSSYSLSDAETAIALSHALGSRSENRLLYHDTDRQLIVVYSYTTSTDEFEQYHGHHFPDTDAPEIQRLPSAIKKKIAELDKLKNNQQRVDGK